jgi:hypothetical protein
MRLSKHRQLAVLMTAAVITAATYQIGKAAAAQQETQISGSNIASKHSGVSPVTEFDHHVVEDTGAKLRRQAREKRMSGFWKEIKDPGKLVDGQPETVTFTFLDYSGERSALPFSTSNAVILGTVNSATAFVSQDHTYVYSDYGITVDSIFKQDSESPISAGESITASRAGGSVHFPSGHVTHFLIHGEGLLAVGEQYVLFLWKPTPNVPEYQISTGYLSKNGRMQALDDGHPFSDFDDVPSLVFAQQLSQAEKGAQ